MLKKILVGFIQDGRHSGIDKYLLGFCSVAHENGVMLDFMTDEITPEMNEYLKNLGYGLFAVPSLKNPVLQYGAIKKIIRENGYDCVYINISESFNCMGLLAAKKCGVPVRIVHSHSSGVDRGNKYVRAVRTFIHRLFRHCVSTLSTRRLACSSVAGKWMFDKDYEIIYNAVDGSRFAYDKAMREATRQSLGLADENVFIHIGHFSYTKNHFFLLDVMNEILKSDKNAVLLSVGIGPDFDSVREYAKKLGIDNNIRFLGVRDDIPELMSAADAFVFPSRFEGLSITCVEAQFSGLPCILSNGISPETKLADNVCFLPADNAESWAACALSSISQRKDAVLNRETLKNYDIVNQKKQLVSVLKGE